jgi:hypothetical protein
MPKDFVKGADYKLYLDTAGNWASPTWVEISAVGDITVDPQKADVSIPERGLETGHLHGHGDPVFGFTLYEDVGNANIETLIAAIHSGAMVHLAVSRRNIATGGSKYHHLEAVLYGSPLAAGRDDPSSWEVQAMRHANSDNELTRATT